MLAFLLAATIAAPVNTNDCNRPPRVVKKAQFAYPDDTDQLGPGLLEVIVKLTIDPSGKLAKAEIVESSGYDAFDNAVIKAVEDSTYAPAEVACAPATAQSVFVVQFTNKYVNDGGEITPPTFTFPAGWNATATTTPLPDGMNTVAEYTRGDERVIIASEHPHGDFDGAAAADRMIEALHLQPVSAQSGTIDVCSGFQSGWSEHFDYPDGAQTRSGELIEVQGANGLFSLFYSKLKSALPDDGIDHAIARFCVQGAPPARPRAMDAPAG